MSSTRTLLQNQNIEFDVSYNEFSFWQLVGSETPQAENEHQSLWYHHVGKALGVLLYSAGYCPDAQRRNLNFFKQTVAPNIGVFQEASGGQEGSWQSFMTDDGTPLELSWDWGTKDSQPTLRYSIEPIGLRAGTWLDPRNLLAGPVFQNDLNRTLPDMRLESFHYFKNFFDGRAEERTPDHEPSILYRYFCSLRDFFMSMTGERQFSEAPKDHNSSIFYAFDLTEADTTAKVYFFPKYRALSCGKSNLEVLLQGIKGAPYCTADNLPALSVFSDFSNDAASKKLEYEMLAIDLIDPLQSRFKVYFRSRETSFDSLTRIITLGDRIKNIERGLEDLRYLWNAIFGVNGPSNHALKEVNHRTAGMLYNVEFRIDDQYPVAKVYLPVRHYSASDGNVIEGLDEFFRSHQRGSYMTAYSNAMVKLFGSESLRSQAGVQTYVGCTIRPDGALRVVSYFKPPLSDHSVSTEKACS
ncbi:tryptophan dimethylallyltransferase-domain-containing protein [Xylaria castorea]|nr:tryptophan dimethylallyltransferase-domain-containing protein [Xylaria castorea]